MTGAGEPRRVAIVGDVAGHLDELTAELSRLGAGEGGELPADLVVVQVGDLVHRGPDSDGVVALADRYLREQPAQWLQLVGNHEAQYLREPAFEWDERIGRRARDTVRGWWASGRMRAAAAVSSGDEDFVVTHAGITNGFWRNALDSPASASDATRAINSFIGAHEDVLFNAGTMLGGGRPNPDAGPVWAAPAEELVAGWLGVAMPFSQAHGHATIADWKRRALRCDDRIAELVSVDPDTAQEIVTLDRGRIVGVDPGHGRRAHRPWRAFVLDGAMITS